MKRFPTMLAFLAAFLAVFLMSLSAARAQVAYNFQPPDAIAIPAPLTTLTMDCLAANGYGQWTTSNSTSDAHLLANKLTSSTVDNPQAGILSSTAFTYNAGDAYPTTNEIKAVANLAGNVRYVWLQRQASPASDEFYVEGFNPGNPGVDISFSTLPTDATIVKGSALGGSHSITAGHHVVSSANEANPLDRFDAAIDASNVYIVWEEYSGGVYTLWSMVVSTSGAVVLPATELTDPNTGVPMNGQKPTIAVDIRNSGAVAPFDIAFLSAGNVEWTEWNPGTAAFSSAVSIPKSYIDPYDGTTQAWTNPSHARILVASQAGVTPSAMNQRGIYLVAENPHNVTTKRKYITALGGPSLFLERIVAATAQPLNEYCDGPYNTARPANCPVEGSYPDYSVITDPLWALSNPYEGTNAGSTNPANTFNGFHCLYRLDRSAVHTGTAGEYPLMIIPSSSAGQGFCVNGSSATTFYDDPVANGNGVMQYCGAVNQMGIHTHWISAATHYYRRDRHEFDQDIEENTLMTDKCSVSANINLTNKWLTLYADPSTAGATGYLGAGALTIQGGSKLAIDPSGGGGDFVAVGAESIAFDGTAGDIIEVDADNQMDFYGNAYSKITGVGEFKFTGSGDYTVSSSYGSWPGGISDPATLNIHGGTVLDVGYTPNANYFTCNDAIIHINYETNVLTGSGNAEGELILNDHSSFTKCWIYSDDNNAGDDPTAIDIAANGYAASGTGNADYNAATPSYAVDTFEQCVFFGGTGDSHATMEISDPNVAPNSLIIDNGEVSGWSIKGGHYIYWPIIITDVTFYEVIEDGLDISFATTPPTADNKLYSLLVDGCGFQGYADFTNFPNPDGIEVEEAPDVITGSPTAAQDALRQDITITNNTFESTDYIEPVGGVEAAIHFSDCTGDIGYNNISGKKYQRGIWNESSVGGSHDETWTFICSNTISALTHAGAAGLSTDNYQGFVKLNSITGCYYGHLSAIKDDDHEIATTLTGNTNYGYYGISSSITDFTGIHHPSDPSIDVAAFNVITTNNSSGTQIYFDGTSTGYFGLAPDSPTWPTTAYGLNNIQGTPDICGWSGLSLGDISNNYWGGGTYTLCPVITGSGGYLTTAPGSSGFVCSSGLITKRKGSNQQSITEFPDSTCSALYGLGYGLMSEGSEPAGYDTLRAFIEQCPLYYGQGDGETPWDAFNHINAAISQWGAGGNGRWAGYLTFLKHVLYLNPDTLWYCYDVLDMITAEQANEAMQVAELKYLLDNNRCPIFTSDIQTLYNSASRARHQMWLDSVVSKYDSVEPYGKYQWWLDSMVNKDTLANPYDSTIPTLQQVGLEILMGPQNGVTQPNTPITSQALLNASILDNPMKDEIAVGFEMGRTALVTMELRDILGRSIPLTYARYQLMQQGMHKAYIPAPNLPPGTYYLRISTDVGDVITLKVVKQ